VAFVFFLVAVSVIFTDFCFKESRYYCLKVNYDEETGIKKLALDKLVHSISDMNDPGNITYEYAQVFAVFYEYFSQKNPRVLFLGGGGYTLPRYLVNKFSNPEVTVVEIDPAVSGLAFSEFDMPRNSSVETVNQDARIFLKNLDTDKRFLIIFGDVFSDFAIPYHLTTREFNKLLLAHLSGDGYYVANVIDQLNPGLFLKSYIRTLKETFSYVYLFLPEAGRDKEEVRSTFVVVAGQVPLDMDSLELACESLGYGKKILRVYPDVELNEWLSEQKRPIVLTDDFAPADNLIAPVYIASVPALSQTFKLFWKEVETLYPGLFRAL
jgi:spermidine synthase